MKNVTLSLDENLVKTGREYAKKFNMSLNTLIRKLLSQTVNNSSGNWMDECFLLMDKANGRSSGKKWTREDLYDV